MFDLLIVGFFCLGLLLLIKTPYLHGVCREILHLVLRYVTCIKDQLLFSGG
jgi:hypothetical protein